MTFIVNAVSPLHEAVLRSQRRLLEYNQTYRDGFELHEAERPWTRAFVLTNFFRSDHVEGSGFERVERYEDLELGDLAVPIIDASSTPHFDPDSRKNAEGEFSLPARSPYPQAKAGGIGAGTAWFALDRKGRVLQRRLGPSSQYFDVVIGAVRLRDTITLVPELLDEDGNLFVEIFANSPAEYDGFTYGRLPVRVAGRGGIRLGGSGRLVLTGDNDYTGRTIVESGELVVDSSTGLGAGDVEIQGGTLRLYQAAIDDRASVRLSETLEDGAVYLGFAGADSVHSLQVGDKEYRCGTWGGLASEAMFVDPRFSGPGMLELLAEPQNRCAP